MTLFEALLLGTAIATNVILIKVHVEQRLDGRESWHNAKNPRTGKWGCKDPETGEWS